MSVYTLHWKGGALAGLIVGLHLSIMPTRGWVNAFLNISTKRARTFHFLHLIYIAAESVESVDSDNQFLFQQRYIAHGKRFLPHAQA